MSEFRRKGHALRYAFADPLCIGRQCWAPGVYQHRGATLSGSRNTGATSPCCMTRAYHGCPDGPVGEKKEIDPIYGLVTISGLPVASKELMAERKADGWRKA